MIKKGFTLSETLFALLVIGVVVAILLPSIKKIMPSNNKVMFKKAYSTLEMTINNLINDNISYPESQVGTDTYTNSSTFRGFNFTTKSDGTYYTNNKFCTLYANMVNTVGTVTCPTYSTSTSGSFTTTDGVVWTIKPAASDSSSNTQFPLNSDPTVSTPYATKFTIDVNGSSKGPNCSTDAGISTYSPYSGTYTTCPHTSDCQDEPDTFIFGIRFDGKIQIGSGSSTDSCANSILLAPATFTK